MFWIMDHLSYRNTGLVPTKTTPSCCGHGDSKIFGCAGINSLPLRTITIDKITQNSLFTWTSLDVRLKLEQEKTQRREISMNPWHYLLLLETA